MTQPALHLFELADPGLPRHESYSPFCLKVNRALKVRQLRFERHPMPRPDAHGLTKVGQVPVLVIGEPGSIGAEVVHDSTPILRRIGELTGRPFEVGDASQRAEAALYEELADTALNGFLVASRWADERNWPRVKEAYFGTAPWPVRALIVPRLRDRTVGALRARDIWRDGPDACWKRFSLLIDALSARAPSRGYWLGSEITSADLALFGQLHSLRTELTPWQYQVVDDHAPLRSYLDRVDEATRSDAPQPRVSDAPMATA